MCHMTKLFGVKFSQGRQADWQVKLWKYAIGEISSDNRFVFILEK